MYLMKGMLRRVVTDWHNHCVFKGVKFKTGYIPDPQQLKGARRGVSGGTFARDCAMRILVAEDDEMCRQILGMFLETLGYHPTMVENGRDCLQQAMHDPFDLILTDLEMPEMSGLDCARELRRFGKDVYIIAVSGCSAPHINEQCMEAGMNGFLAKPFDGAELKSALKTAFASVKAKQALMA